MGPSPQSGRCWGRGTHPDWKADGELARKRKERSRSPGKMGKPGAQERGE